MTKETAYLSCRCGRCRITLCDPAMRYRAECLCVDCRQRALISASRAQENALPAPVEAYERGVDLYYFTNALIVDDTSFASMEFFKLRADADNTTCISTCCGTLMCGTHPIYGGTTISVNANSCRVTVSKVLPSTLITFGGDISAEKCEAIRQRDARPMLIFLETAINEPYMHEFLAAVTAPVPEQYSREGRTFEALCAAHNNTKIDNACFEESRAGKPGQAAAL